MGRSGCTLCSIEEGFSTEEGFLAALLGLAVLVLRAGRGVAVAAPAEACAAARRGAGFFAAVVAARVAGFFAVAVAACAAGFLRGAAVFACAGAIAVGASERFCLSSEGTAKFDPSTL